MIDYFIFQKDQSVGVYYDYVGLFLITYSYLTAFIMDLVVSLLGFASVVYYLWLYGFRKLIKKNHFSRVYLKKNNILTLLRFSWYFKTRIVICNPTLRTFNFIENSGGIS